MSQLITLEKWAADIYGEAAPKSPTLRAWAKSGKIIPAPQKHGRAYFVVHDARYVAANDDDKHGAIQNTQIIKPVTAPKERAADRLERMIRERKTKTA